MVGLVIVSHSAKLAAGVAELARGMAGPHVPLAATGGLDLPDRPLGTDAALVQQAIAQVYSEDGVLVLMDLGSAVLSAEMALDLFPPEQRAHVLLCEAPLVEGALAAAVQARLGSPLEQVAAEARGALAAKAAQLGAPTTLTPSSPLPSLEDGPELSVQLTIPNRLGLHARPAARFVQTANQYQADVRLRDLTTGRGPANAKSINAVATLGVRQGHQIELIAAGPDAEAALAALRQLADDNFGDKDDEGLATKDEPPPLRHGPQPETSRAGGKRRRSDKLQPDSSLRLHPSSFLKGLPASPGIAIGPARLFRPTAANIPAHTIANPQKEWDALLKAIEQTRVQIRALRAAVARRADRYSAEIFDAHLLFLDDEALREPARRAIFDDHLNAAAAWQRATEQVAAEYRALDDEYLRARAADVTSVGQQVIGNVLGQGATTPALTQAGILVAPDLTPADTARLDPALVLGICTAFGGSTSHSAILARNFGIPAVVGLGESLLALAEGTPLVVDGEAGEVYPDPDPALVAEYTRRADAARRAREQARALSATPAITRDGRRIEVVANIGSPADARAAVAAGAEGVGLFRTEFLFLDRQTAPDEEEQYTAYRAVAQIMGERPIIVRTLDAGGDKPLPYLDLGAEANPFLGFRAVRVCLARPGFFKTQLRAIVRVAAEFPVKVMFPMIATLDEWRAARALLAEARAEVQQRGQAVPDRIETGIMVEIPAAALRARRFAAEVDFFSIGTNDLTQYTLAAERGNARVAALADAFQPAVLQLIQSVVEAAHAQGKWVGVCGEMGGEPLAVPLLVGLGVDELSMNAPAIPQAKQIIRAVDYGEARQLAEAALGLESAEAVRKMLNAER
ncbi:MAG TPA: phosphoenolpyruvate--protein phosphotransferase [Anaerolineae bacterium]|nr:phosphoenolpyruvate--protein phosphotransferase [Anaerolineae bacterium]